jgi:hypothetical protein
MSVSTEKNRVRKTPSNTSFEIQLNNNKSNFQLVIDNYDFYSGNRLKLAEKNSLVPKKFQPNF